MKDRKKLISLYKEYVKNGGVITPMNTESCRRYLQEKCGEQVEPEDVLWIFYRRYTWSKLNSMETM